MTSPTSPSSSSSSSSTKLSFSSSSSSSTSPASSSTTSSTFETSTSAPSFPSPSTIPPQCSSCHLATTIPPKIPLYGPYNCKELQADKLYSWCSCGLSKTQPFCDGSHSEWKKKTGQDFKPVSFKAKKQTIHQLCGCKYTKSPPFCDGTHIHMEIPPTKPPCLHFCETTTHDW